MRRIAATMTITAALGLAACQQSPAENAAEQLENAAAQSDPAAAAELENAADAMRESDAGASVNAPGSAAQEALENGGAAQVQTP